MKTFLWLSLCLGLTSGAARPEADSGLDPRPQHLAPFLLDGLFKRDGPARPANIDLTAWKPGAVKLQWAGDILVGTPPQKFSLIFDTGAPMMLIAANNCTTCGTHPRFDPSKSSSFSPQPGFRITMYFNSGGGGTINGPQQQNANCTVVTDTVRMVDRPTSGSQLLICDTYSNLLREQTPDGLFGLSSTPTSLWGIEPNLPTPEFSFSYIPSHGPNGRRDGVLTLGGTDRSQYIPSTLRKIPLNWPLSESGMRWVVDVRGARIDGYTLHNSTDAVTLIDTGSAVVSTPDHETTAELYARMSDAIQPIDERGAWGAPCDELDRAVRDVVFTVGSPGQKVDVVVKKKYMNVGEYPGKPGICQGVFVDPERVAREPINGRPAWIFGTPWLRSYYTVWNGVDRTIGFATPSRPDCD
ncbi:aspartic peptidase domain-containing protein [Chaetomium strumarium]|uniref:Aspartic peptidase domain-containing protein n=1 Tax=Chaetomium strumarium TaxID=1170767 RepID=A0AAJ0LZ56_9PEZI|nr:aspartic peptidase domain-containing protein [Chaetomium strumarium]